VLSYVAGEGLAPGTGAQQPQTKLDRDACMQDIRRHVDERHAVARWACVDQILTGDVLHAGGMRESHARARCGRAAEVGKRKRRAYRVSGGGDPVRFQRQSSQTFR